MTERVSEYNFSEEQIIEAIQGSCGIISNIAESLGCDWSTAKKYVNKYEVTKQAYSDESERVIDKAESKLQAAIDNGDMQMVKWYLATIGKKRGFSEKTEIQHSGEVSSNFTLIGIDAKDKDSE